MNEKTKRRWDDALTSNLKYNIGSLDFETKDRLQSGRGNAMLVAGSIYEACKYYELFQKHGLKKKI